MTVVRTRARRAKDWDKCVAEFRNKERMKYENAVREVELLEMHFAAIKEDLKIARSKANRLKYLLRKKEQHRLQLLRRRKVPMSEVPQIENL